MKKANNKKRYAEISKILYILATVAIIIALIFISFALRHPEMSFSLAREVVIALYLLYIITTIAMLVIAFVFRKKSKK